MNDRDEGMHVPPTELRTDRGESWSQWRMRRRMRMRGRERAFELFFKETVYASFTGFAIVVVILLDGHSEARQALGALVLGVLGIIIAGFVAEIVAHLAVHGVQHTGPEFALVAWTSAGGLGTVLAPALLLLLAATGVLPLAAALTATIIVYVATFGVIGWLAINGAPLAWWKQLLALGGLILVGFGVVGLQALAHGF
ncbi:hypothetical protein ACLQ2Q_08435 [Microbacterium sp. DT81.1]|uniref:hypothetical protein n=1 Tax=Microbacterium sp. DT81.1 TaxID=3393413 RepID=UPI003CEC646B